MKPIKRHLHAEATTLATQFRALCIVGPRQSGKTTLSKLVFGSKPYFSLENPATEIAVTMDAELFLKRLSRGAILDEVQRAPILFRYLQGVLDQRSQRGQFILTGSNNFLLQEQVSQSLAGRVGYLELLPLSYGELKDARRDTTEVVKHIFTGGYPEIWQHHLHPTKWISSYVQTYVQRDVRLLRNITNLNAFTRFIQLCAGYAGQLLNKDQLAKSTGVDAKTVQSWLSLLESSYIIYLLPPYHDNLNKRIVKSPKLYFYDTGLLCFLLGFRSEAQVSKSDRYGAIFENWIMTEIRKNRYNQGISGGMHYFRDSTGNEVDLILDKSEGTVAVEIKSSRKFNSSMLNGIRYWLKYNRNGSGSLIYGADDPSALIDEGTALLSWKDVATFGT